MKKNILSAIIGAGMFLPLFITGCGDPTLNLSGSKEEVKESLKDMLNSLDAEDKIAFISWYNGSENQRKVIDGRKASEIIRIVRNDWKEKYIRNNINVTPLKLWIENTKSGFNYSDLSGVCNRLNGTEKKELSDYQKETLARIKRDEELFSGIEYTCQANPNKKNSLLLTVKNNSRMPLSSVQLKIDRHLSDHAKIPGGVAPGEQSTLEITSHYADLLSEGYDCYPVYYSFYDVNDKKDIDINIYDPYSNRFFSTEMSDYQAFSDERKNYYYSINGQDTIVKDLCASYTEITDQAIDRINGVISSLSEENK